MKVKVTITLTDDDHTQEGEEMQVEIEETIPDGFQNLDQWEKNVHNIGFRSMRELFKGGIEFFQGKVLSGYTHRDERCQTSKRGSRDFTLSTVGGNAERKQLRHNMSKRPTYLTASAYPFEILQDSLPTFMRAFGILLRTNVRYVLYCNETHPI